MLQKLNSGGTHSRICGLTEHLDGNPSRLEVFKKALGTSKVTLAWRTLSSNMAEAMAKQTNGSVKHAMTNGRAPHFVNQDQSRGCKRCVEKQWELHCASGRQAGSVREIFSLGTASHSIGQKVWESLAQAFRRRFVILPSGLDLKSLPSQTTLQTLEEHCQSALESRKDKLSMSEQHMIVSWYLRGWEHGKSFDGYAMTSDLFFGR